MSPWKGWRPMPEPTKQDSRIEELTNQVMHDAVRIDVMEKALRAVVANLCDGDKVCVAHHQGHKAKRIAREALSIAVPGAEHE